MENNNSFFDSFGEKLGKLSTVLSKNMYITAIKDGMLAYMPFTVIASIFLIIAFLPIQPYTDFISTITHSEPAIWQGKLALVNSASLGLGGILVLFTVSHNMAKQLEINQLQVQLTSFVAFMLLVPFGASKQVASFIDVTYMGAQTIFLAIVTAIFSAKIYKFIDDKNIKIKMPDSVPPAVSQPFESIVPSLLVVTVFWLVRLVIDGFHGGSALAIFNAILGAPLQAIGGSLPGIIIVKVFSQLLWFFGIHGDSIVNGVMTPILQVLQESNKAATLAGQVPTHIINQSFWDNFASIGIVGSIVAICIVAKSKRYKEMRKIAGIPYIFNIGEPTLFGIPLMMNVTFFIPFLLANVASIVISYIAFATGLVPIATGLAQVPWTTPIIISGYLVTGSIAGSILQLVCLVVVTLIWIPFIKIEDKKIVKEEEAFEEEKS